MKDLMFGLLRFQTKKTDEELRELLFEDVEGEEKLKANALDLLSDLDAQRVSGLKMDEESLKEIKGAEFDKGFKKAQGQLMSDFEKDLKSKFNFQSDLQGQDLIEALIKENSKGDGKGSGTITDDDVKRHPLFIKVTDDHQSQLKTIDEEWSKKYGELENNHKSESVFGNVKDRTEQIWTEAKAVFPENGTHASSLKNVILNELRSFEYQKQDDKIIVLKDGKVLEDKHGHRVNLEDHLKSTTSKYVGFQEVAQRSSSGSDDEGGKGGDQKSTKWTGPMPKNDDEFVKMMADESRENRILLNNAYQESKAD